MAQYILFFMPCDICGNNAKLVYQKFPGYVENDLYDIYQCSKCDAQFVDPKKVDPKLYDIIYSDRSNKEGPAGYGQHLTQAEKVKDAKDPLAFLLNTDGAFYPVREYLKDKKTLNILEIGAGYGYLTYALQKIGHKAYGIDLSEFAINYALTNLGPWYERATIEEYAQKANGKKFDLIIAMEVLEHVSKPISFIESALSLLKKEGRMVLTTPNKGYYANGSIWLSDQPPVHLFWYSPKTIAFVADKYSLNVNYTDIAKYLSKEDKPNLLVNFLRSRKKVMIPDPIFNQRGDLYRRESSVSCGGGDLTKNCPFFLGGYLSNQSVFEYSIPISSLFSSTKYVDNGICLGTQFIDV